MIFLVLNAIICVTLIIFSFSIDAGKEKNFNTNYLVNIVLFLAALFGMMAVTVGFCFFAPPQLALTFGRLTYLLLGWFSVNSCCFLMVFPQYEKKTPLFAFQWISNILGMAIIFLAPRGCISNISITYDNTFQISSGLMISGRLGRVLMISWFQFYMGLFVYAVPLFFCLMALVRAENVDSMLTRQRIRIASSGVFASFAVFAFITFSSIYQPMLKSLIMVGFIPELIGFMEADKNNEIWDKKIIFHGVGKFLVKYFLPATLIGLFFTVSWPIFVHNHILFFVLFVVESTAILTIWYLVGQYIAKRGFLRDSRYAEAFTNEISSISFEGEPGDITAKLFNIFNKYVDSSSLKMLVDAGSGFMEYVYSSNPEDTKKTVPVTGDCFDKLMNLKRQVVFREAIEHDYALAAVRTDLLALLRETETDAFILLSEGHRIIGVMALGKKQSGNVYSDYDYRVFNELYSNFFVIGYYMKNIMNESVVGTVDREIKMSNQIITSIQENMDFIKNPKVDSGYLMVPAHNIGGEFVDTIRLTDTRYIYVIGSLSGKGIAASMNMVIMKSIIRTYLAETTDFKLLVQKVNLFIRESLPKGTFFSGTFGLVDFSTDTMYYINCGTPAIFMYTRAYNNVIEIQGEGHILGFAKDISSIVKVKKVKLAPGDIVFTCTDGLIETKSLRGEKFGKARLQNEIMENSSYPASKMAQFSYESLAQFTSAALEDDVTIFLFKYLGAAKEEGSKQ